VRGGALLLCVAVLTGMPALSSAAPAPTPRMTPATWRSYVEVRGDLIRQVNAFIRKEGACTRAKGLVTPAWGECLNKPLFGVYLPVMGRMITFLSRAFAKVTAYGDCWDAILRYSNAMGRARSAALGAIGDARAAKTFGFTRARLVKNYREFRIARNQATNARFRVDARCAP
jgi:hypothetical protein